MGGGGGWSFTRGGGSACSAPHPLRASHPPVDTPRTAAVCRPPRHEVTLLGASSPHSLCLSFPSLAIGTQQGLGGVAPTAPTAQPTLCRPPPHTPAKGFPLPARRARSPPPGVPGLGVLAVEVHSEAPAVAVATGLEGACALGTGEPLGWRAGAVLQCDGLAGDRAPICSSKHRDTPPCIRPAKPPPRGAPPCPQLAWARCWLPPLSPPASKLQPTGTPRDVLSPGAGARHRMPRHGGGHLGAGHPPFLSAVPTPGRASPCQCMGTSTQACVLLPRVTPACSGATHSSCTRVGSQTPQPIVVPPSTPPPLCASVSACFPV